MYCPKCGSQRPDEDDFCAKCGASLHGKQSSAAAAARPMKFEYKDHVVPIRVKMAASPPTHPKNCALVDPIVLRELQRVGEEGWQPDEPTSANRLLFDGRVKYKTGVFSTTIESITVRMKRLAPG